MPKAPGITLPWVAGKTGTTDLLISTPAGTLDWDIMLMFLTHKGLDWAVVPAGWEAVQRNTTPDGVTRGEVYWKRAAAEGANHQVLGLADTSCALILSYPGCIRTGTPINASSSRSNPLIPAPGEPATDALTTTVPNTVIVISAHVQSQMFVGGWGDSGPVSTFPGDRDLGLMELAAQQVSTTGTQCRISVGHGLKIVPGYTRDLGCYPQGPVPMVVVALALMPDTVTETPGTRYYLGRQAISARLLAPSTGQWHDRAGGPTAYTNHQPWRLSQTKAGLGEVGYNLMFTCNQQANHDIVFSRYMSPPLAAQTLGGTLDLIFSRAAYFEDAGPKNTSTVRLKLHAYVSVGPTLAVRHTLVDNYVDPVTFPYLSKVWASLAAPQALPPVAIEAGDCLVVETGIRIVSSPTPVPTYPPTRYTVVPVTLDGATQVTTQAYAGLPYTQDGVPGSTAQAMVPYLSFSQTVVEQTSGFVYPPNETPETALDIPALPYQSPVPLDTTRSRYPNRSVWYTFTPPKTARYIFSTYGSTYVTAWECYTGLPGALVFANLWVMSGGGLAMVDLVAGVRYTFRVYAKPGQSGGGGFGFPASDGGQLIVRVSERDTVPQQNDLYVPAGYTIVWRDGVIVNGTTAFGGDAATACTIAYKRRPMEPLYGGPTHVGDRLILGIHEFAVIEILDLATLNLETSEIDYIDDAIQPVPQPEHYACYALDPDENLIVAAFGNGYLYVTGVVRQGKSAFHNAVSDAPAKMALWRVPAHHGDNQPGAPFPFGESFNLDPGSTSPHHIALSPDGTTVFYTSCAFYFHGDPAAQIVKRYHLPTRTQLPDFVTVPVSDSPVGGARGLAVHPNGSVLVANGSNVVWFDPTGAILHTFTPAETGDAQHLMDVQIQADGLRFWVGDGRTTAFWRFNLQTRQQEAYLQTFQSQGAFSQFAIFRPGGVIDNPPLGPPPEPEPCYCCFDTQLGIINDALGKLGVSQFVVTLDERSKEAQLGVRAYPKALLDVLRRHPWGFATKYLALTLVGGTATAPFNLDWRYAYRYPSDCVMGRRLVPPDGSGRRFARTPIPWRASRTTHLVAEQNVPLILTNEPDAVLEYTALVACRLAFHDALFEDALAARVACELCPALVRDKTTLMECERLAAQALGDAMVMDLREQQQEPDGDQAAWNEGRA